MIKTTVREYRILLVGKNAVTDLCMIFSLLFNLAIAFLFRRKIKTLVRSAYFFTAPYTHGIKLLIKDPKSNRTLLIAQKTAYLFISSSYQVHLTRSENIPARVSVIIHNPYSKTIRLSFTPKHSENPRGHDIRIGKIRLAAFDEVASGNVRLRLEKDGMMITCKQFIYPVRLIAKLFDPTEYSLLKPLLAMDDPTGVSFSILLNKNEIKWFKIKHLKFSNSSYTKMRDTIVNHINEYRFKNRNLTFSDRNMLRIDNENITNEYLVNTVLFKEDPFFFEHKGFSFDGLISGLNKNFKAKKIIKGGSTITNQLCKNIFLNNDRSILRKIKEAFLTDLIERNQLLSKLEILNLYLQHIELGPDIWGVVAFAKNLLDKSIEEISLADAIFITYVIPRPSIFTGNFHKDGTLKNILMKYFSGTLHGLYNRRIINGSDFNYGIKNLKAQVDYYECLIWDKNTDLNLRSLNPKLSDLATELMRRIKEVLKTDVCIICGYRTYSEQQRLFESGKNVTNAMAGESLHNLGLAFDLVPVDGNLIALWNYDRWNEIGNLGKDMGLTWGGDFSTINDYGHFELKKDQVLV